MSDRGCPPISATPSSVGLRHMQTSFFADLLHSIAVRGRSILHRAQRGGVRPTTEGLIGRCEDLLSRRGEASPASPSLATCWRSSRIPPPMRVWLFSKRSHPVSDLITRVSPPPSKPGDRNRPARRPLSCPLLSSLDARNSFGVSTSHQVAPPFWWRCDGSSWNPRRVAMIWLRSTPISRISLRRGSIGGFC